jgi:hypothetical protein
MYEKVSKILIGSSCRACLFEPGCKALLPCYAWGFIFVYGDVLQLFQKISSCLEPAWVCADGGQ